MERIVSKGDDFVVDKLFYFKPVDRHKNKTAYLQRVQYLDGSYRLSLLLKLKTLSHETHSFDKSCQTDTEPILKIFMHTYMYDFMPRTDRETD